MTSKVIVKYCDEYRIDLVRNKIKESLNMIGGIRKWIEPGMKVAVKPNLLAKKKPEEAVTTHPIVAQAVIEIIQEAGAYPFIIDSPGGPEARIHLKNIYRQTGMEEVARKTGIELNYSMEKDEVIFKQGSQYRKFYILKRILDSDAIINIPKLKTHSLTMLTCGVKNLFGVIPGLIKGEYHLTMQNRENFASLLVDLAFYVNPSLTVVDGIVGMEGEGPSAGRPIKSSYIVTSENVFDIDYAVADLIGMEPDKVPTVSESIKMGLSVSSIKEIDFCGTYKYNTKTVYKPPKTLRQLDFKDRITGILPLFLVKRFYGLIRPVVKINEQQCSACSICKKSCPPDAIDVSKNKLKINMNKCIRCYCCQELCPEKAIDINYPWLGKIMFRRN